MDGEANELPKAISLDVANFGKVKFPLDECQAKELIKVCHPAPFGKNEMTLYDKKVRDSFQIDPSKVTITNRNWENKLAQLVKRVGSGLGCQDEIEVSSHFLIENKQNILIVFIPKKGQTVQSIGL